MENTKIPFFKRLKRAILNFESYSDFAIEKMSVAIKYFAKLMIIFSIIISIAYTYKFSNVVNDEEQLQIMQNQLLENGVDLSAINDSMNYIKTNNNIQFYSTLALSIAIYCFGIFFILGLIDALMISIIGFIASRITKILLKYKSIFTMSIYALTLPIILNCIYIVANTLTGFTIDYFSIVYNVIAYIYIITAILMIKTDFIEQQRELVKIIHEQQKIEKEQENEKEPEEKQDEEDKDKENPPEQEPNSEPGT